MTETAPSGLRIDAGGDQFPVSADRPRLSWLPLDGADGYELHATIDDVSLEPVSAAGHRLNSWPWRPLQSGERVRWRVRVPGGTWSEEHVFEAGLLDADWSADWISPPTPSDVVFGKRPGHSLRRSFAVDRPLRRARLYSTALGVYEAFVNGSRVGAAELSPGSTSYDKTVYAQAADVAPSLNVGENTLELVLTDGWYQGQVGAFHARAAWTDGDDVAARAELHLLFEDGTTETVRTDGSWTSWTSPIVRAGLMDGQATDLTVEPSQLGPVRVGAVTAPPISWSPAPPVRRVEVRPPVWLTRLDSGSWIADFGQNASGWTRLTDLGPRGSRTSIEHGEHLDSSGDLDMSHLDSEREGDGLVVLDQRDEVVSDGSDGSAFEPRHTVHGFQYARIQRGDLPLSADAITMQVVNTDLAPAGSFRCSDDDLNRLYEIANWSFRGNAVDIPTDCPQRERIGWTGDYQVFASTAVRLFDVHGFTRKWLQSVRDDQLDDGRIANFSPDGRQVKHHPDLQVAQMTGSAGWGDAIIHVPWILYETYGDRDELAANWDAMTRWVEWALDTARTCRHPSRVQRSPEPLPHEQYLWDGSFHWGEWCEPKERAADGSLVDPLQDNPMAWFMEDKGEVGTAYLYRSTTTLARIAAILGREGDAARYTDEAQHVRDAWRTEFLPADGRTVKDTQAAYVRALSFGLIPDHLRSRAADRLVELIRRAGNHLGTGFLSTADLLPVLVETGHADVAYEVLFQRTSPSWLGMLDRGATTIWEDWDGVDEDGRAFASLNHYSKGAVVRFLHTHLLGLDQAPDSVAWESFLLRPVPGGGVTWAEGSYRTPQGTIEASWRIEDGRITVSGAVPPATTGTIVLPDGRSIQVGPGRFTVSSAA
ncbi:alpha-L-rhamnosidase [Leifsonia sp. 98AMF]|nr:alpha-L-rhamnosidase [Leifsonia sp. 197AMF]SDI78282.1 alpha-L-rhamnosidase [Leifsonia sp. 466MF]SDK08071.1 alpha-L-rhamnosidase [Leifsonia sp. 157MF]SDN81749.1 alpha-L-rhamnosidase [Leifsonia sp. 509MF]SEN25607.1 alpha-L-rhamnosidase [Leifsonia sp. 467MF]SFL83630.1 alpha-L-rhamnosidase [Leifsonia sp. 98AMF]